MYKIIGVDGKEYGPVSIEQLRQWLGEGRINLQTRVLPEGATAWKTLGEVAEFTSSVPSPQTITTPRITPQTYVPDYMTQAVLVTLCCCIPLGIPALINAAQVKTRLSFGDVAGAQENSAKARFWCWMGFGVGLVGIAVYVVIRMLLLGAGALAK